MEQKDTKQEEHWQRFMKTGCIADYLSYTAGRAGEPQSGVTRETKPPIPKEALEKE